MKTVAVAGYGYVGKAVVDFFVKKYKVKIYDPIHNGTLSENAWFVDSLEELSGADLLVSCVPTPMKADRTCDTSIVEDVLNKVDVKNVLIKSTVVPGTTDKLVHTYYTNKEIAFSPEYIGEGGYYDKTGFATDMYNTPFWIVGGTDSAINAVLDLVVPIGGPAKTYYKTTAKEAEVIKYMENIYFGVKVMFANQMFDACKALDVDWYRVREGWALDPRVDKMHTAVFPDNRGFGGKCLPKDLNAFIKSCELAGFDFELLKTVVKVNEELYNPDARPKQE